MGIHIESLSFSYGDKLVIDNINLNIATGEAVGIVGASGGGKSTLLKLISGLYDTQKGRIGIDRAYTSAERRNSVAMVMQSAMLFPASIRENITCGHIIDQSTIRNACVASQLTDWITTLPDGIDTYVGERGGKVSGGQAQRIAIARALVKDAPVVLLDEPTSALDCETSVAVMASVSNLTRGKTVLHVSHRPETLCDCTYILRLERGKLYVP